MQKQGLVESTMVSLGSGYIREMGLRERIIVVEFGEGENIVAQEYRCGRGAKEKTMDTLFTTNQDVAN